MATTQRITLDTEIALCTRADAMRFLRLDPNEAEPDLIEMLINAASALCESYCGRKLKGRSYVSAQPRGNPLGSEQLLVQEYPIISVTELRIASLDNTTEEVQVATSYLIDGELGTIRLLPAATIPSGQLGRSGWPEGWRIRIDYEGGFEPIPADLKQAALIITASMYTKVDQKDHRIASRAIEGITESFEDPDIPIEAKIRLDAGYKRAGFFSAMP